jgi:hypothetical protein
MAVITLVTDAIGRRSSTFHVASITAAVSSYMAHSYALTVGGPGGATGSIGIVVNDPSGARSAKTRAAVAVEIIVRGGPEAYRE